MWSSDVLITSRRSFLGGLLSALAAPAIVHAGDIMPVRNFIILPEPSFDSFDNLMPEGMQYQWMSVDENMWITNLPSPPSWTPVPAQRHRKQFDIPGNIIKVGQNVLIERPKEMCIAARGAEIAKAHSLKERWTQRVAENGFDGFYGGARFSIGSPEFRTIVLEQ
jgi:hypothetical protein